MSLRELLSDSCMILDRTLDTSKKTTVETWTPQSGPVPCRLLKRASRVVAEKAQNATLIRSTFMLQKYARIAIRSRISHGGRMYDVIEVVDTRRVRTSPYKVAICEAVAGGV